MQDEELSKIACRDKIVREAILRVLGIVPGSRITGYGVVESAKDGSLTHISDGCVRLKSARPLSERLFEVSNFLSRVIKEFKPDSVAVESIFFAKNVRSAVVLGHVRGVALRCAGEAGLQVFEYAPRMIKETVTGYGHSDKDNVQKMIMLLLKKTGSIQADAADALAAAMCHIQHGRFNSMAPPAGGGYKSFRRSGGFFGVSKKHT
jgi:crossover junction endodeoxyribonuclease RuvC